MRKEICAIGFDLWQVKSGTIFNNILITDDIQVAKEKADAIWDQRYVSTYLKYCELIPNIILNCN